MSGPIDGFLSGLGREAVSQLGDAFKLGAAVPPPAPARALEQTSQEAMARLNAELSPYGVTMPQVIRSTVSDVAQRVVAEHWTEHARKNPPGIDGGKLMVGGILLFGLGFILGLVLSRGG